VIEFAPEVIRASVSSEPADVVRRSAALGGNAAALRTAHALGFAGGDLNADAYTGEEPPDFFFGALADLNVPVPDVQKQDSPPAARAAINLTVSGPAAPSGASSGEVQKAQTGSGEAAPEIATMEGGSAPELASGTGTAPRMAGGAGTAAGSGTTRRDAASAGTGTAPGAPAATAVGPAAVASPGELITAVSTAAGKLSTPRTSAAQPPDVAAGRAFPSALAAPLAPAGGVQYGGGGGLRRPEPDDDLPPDPVPKATKAVTVAAGALLPKLPLPQLLAPPGGPTPALDYPQQFAELRRPEPPKPEKPKPKKPQPESATPDPKQERPAPAPQPQPFVPVLLDLRQPPIPKVDPKLRSAEQSKIRAVLASVKADLPTAAKPFVRTLRDSAGFGELLRQQYRRENVASFWEPVIGDKPLLERLLAPMQAKLDELGEAAGLSAAILEQAVKEKQKELIASGRTVSDQTKALVQARGLVVIGDAEKKAADEQAKIAKEHAQRLKELRKAMTSHDPKLVTQLADERVTMIGDQVTSGILAFEDAAARRIDLLEALTTAYLDAYRIADDAARASARAAAAKAADPAPSPSVVQVPRAPDGRQWLTWAREQVVASMKALRIQTTTDRDTRIAALREAGTTAAAAVRDWADKRLRHKASQQEKETRAVADQTVTEQRLEKARKQAAKDKARDDLVAQIRYAEAFHDARQAEATGTATDAQQEMLAQAGKDADAYLGAADVPGDPLSAVAHHLAEQVGTQVVAMLTESGVISAEVNKLRAKSLDEARSLGVVIFASRPPDATSRVASLSAATREKIGTDEDAVFAALDNLDCQQIDTISTLYEDTYEEKLYDRLDGELSGSEWDRAKALLKSDQVGATAAAIRYETNSWFSAPDRDKIAAAIRTLPPNKGDELKQRFGQSARWYNSSSASLDEVLGDSMRTYKYNPQTGENVEDNRGSEQIGLLLQVNMLKCPEPAPPAGLATSAPRIKASVIDAQDIQNKVDDLQARADAIDLDLALRPAYGPAKADAMDAVFTRMRAEIADANPGWTAEQVNNEVRRRNANVERAYGERFPAEIQVSNFGMPVENLKPEDSKLRQVMAANLYQSGEKEIGTAMLDVDRRAERTARILLADRGAYAADSDVNAGLEQSYLQAADEVKRVEGPRLGQERKDLIEKQQADGHPLTSDQLAEEDRKLDRELERLIDVRAKELMAETKVHWTKTQNGSLDDWVKDKTQWGGEREAVWRLEQGGKLTRAQELKFAVDGWGIDMTQAKKALAGRTPEEIGQISSDYEKITGENLIERLNSETSGENRFDINEALRGEPMTAQERMDALTRRYNYNKDTYFWGGGPPKELAGSMRLLKAEYDDANEAYAKLNDPSATLSVEDRNFLQRSFEAQAARTESRAEEYRASVHAYTDEMVQIVSVIVGAVVVIATMGAAAPLVALAASLCATAATMVVKMALLGEAYGIHEYVDDLAVGVVDAAFAVATAGLGDKLLGVTGVSGAAAAQAQRAAKPLIARLGATLVENVAGAAPSALAGNLVNRDNWRGDMFANVVQGTFTQMGTGMAIGAVVSHSLELGGRIFGAVAGPALEKFRAGRGGNTATEAAMHAAGSAEHQHVPGTASAARAAETPHVTDHVEGGGLREVHPDAARAPEQATAVREVAGERASGTGSAASFRPGPAAEETAPRPVSAPEGTRAEAAGPVGGSAAPDTAQVPTGEGPGPATGAVPPDTARPGTMYVPPTDATGAPLARIEAQPHAVHQQQRAMRREVLADIPPRERSAYAGTPILVLSDAEYTARTGSAEKAQATVLIIDGKPVVVIREGAPLWALREEGRHLKQLADPIHAEHLRLLDERRLEDWKHLPLSERMLSAQAHLELEIETQQDLIADLSHQKLAGSSDPNLQVRLDQAVRSHEALTGRLAELESFRASPDGSPPPAFLDEPSRLNTKKTSPKPPAHAPPDPAAVPTPAELQAAAAGSAKADADLARSRAQWEAQREQALKERAELGLGLRQVSDLRQRLTDIEGRMLRERNPQARAALDMQRRQVLTDFAAAYPDAGKNLALPPAVDPKDHEAVTRHALITAHDTVRSRSINLSDTVKRLDNQLRGRNIDPNLPTAGAHNKVPAQGGQRHHMPSADALAKSGSRLPEELRDSPLLDYSGGAVIQMDEVDHKKTASHGGPRGKQFRDNEAKYILEGKYLDAIKMGIDDIRGNPQLAVKYEKDIQALLDFLTENKAEVMRLSTGNLTLTIMDLR
jgi:hypothetical protein